jgi:peptide deformylase
MSILTYPNPFLRKVCQPVTVFDDNLITIIDKMRKEVVEAKGEALAANQIGIDLRIFVLSPYYRDVAVPHTVINPEIIDPTGSIRYTEGCLSIPGVRANKARYQRFILKYQDETGTQKTFDTKEFYAIVVQHEIEHLNGKLFIDDLSPIEANRIANKINKLRAKK